MPPNIDEYIDYHIQMIQTGDMDPAYGALSYVSERFELNIEQRYWLAFLYGATYCGATAYYMYNEFPDYERISLARIKTWWNSNRQSLIFQSDRRWVRSRNQFADMVESYRNIVGRSQYKFFSSLTGNGRTHTYDNVYAGCGKMYQMGRFGLFIYTEALQAISGLPLEPRGLDLKNAESSRNGLCYAIGKTDWITGKETGRKTLSRNELAALDKAFAWVEAKVKAKDLSGRSNVWNIETSLCAFKKYKRTMLYPDTPKQHQRYIGYYLDRQHDEISAMQANVPQGVCWDVLWQYRKECLRKNMLKEYK